MTSVDNIVRKLFVVREMFDDAGQVSEEHWEHLKGELSRILGYAAEFYDDFDYQHYDCALGVAQKVLDGHSPEDVIYAMAGTAYFMLNPFVEEEVKEFSAETRARLERIRDTHPEFTELAELAADERPS